MSSLTELVNTNESREKEAKGKKAPKYYDYTEEPFLLEVDE